MDIVRSKGEDYVVDSNVALEFKLVRNEEDLEDDTVSFKPEMSHQIFGDSESIFGYKDLKVKLYFTSAKLITYLGLEYTKKIDPVKFDGVEPDNVLQLLGSKLPPNVLSNIDEFTQALNFESDFLPFGELLHSFEVNQDSGKPQTFEIYFCDVSNKKFLNYHERLQTFILFYIDAASFIDVDDEKWCFFTVYEKFKNQNQKIVYAVAGYATVYMYYAYPANIRPRVSQMLILPPFQKKGIGAQLLSTIYNHFIQQLDVLDITVEDPNEEFQQLRDYVDICYCQNLDCFSVDKLKNGFCIDMAKQLQKVRKINKKQARRIYEIMRLKSTNISNEKDFQEFRLDVKKRLNIPFQKEKSYAKKLESLMDDPQYQTSFGLNSTEHRLETLDKLFQETLEGYQKVLQRVSERPLQF
uniref:Histone acetyltransferase type B catalytic subunit n=1 Tax=Clastoptera arizonana TaxID=38151 RepID=A0A1B6D2L5_9HEMI